MSQEFRLTLLTRVANALLGLESLSDGKTAKLDVNKVLGEERSDVHLLRDKSAYEFHLAQLNALLEEAEAFIRTASKEETGSHK